jgi:hypothetical protein
MKITYEPTSENWVSKRDPNFIQKTVSLYHPMDDMTIAEFMDNMITPLLLSMGYSQVSINGVIETDEDKRELAEPRFTIDEIAAYLAGWTMGPYDDIEDLAKKVSVNALSQLRCDQDGIEAVMKLHRTSKL